MLEGILAVDGLRDSGMVAGRGNEWGGWDSH